MGLKSAPELETSPQEEEELRMVGGVGNVR